MKHTIEDCNILYVKNSETLKSIMNKGVNSNHVCKHSYVLNIIFKAFLMYVSTSATPVGGGCDNSTPMQKRGHT